MNGRFCADRQGCRFRIFSLALVLLCLTASTPLFSQTISGTIQDPSGAVIAGAEIHITGGDLAQPIVISSDGAGHFVSPDLKPGTYSVEVVRPGFESLTKTVEVREAVQIQLTLTIAKQKVTVEVAGKGSGFANSTVTFCLAIVNVSCICTAS